MNPTNCIFVFFKDWPGKNMDEYNHHYHQLILIIIIIINWYKYNPFTWMAPLGWLAGFLEYFVSISSRILPPIISYFDKNFILFLWSLSYIFKQCIRFWSSHRMRRPLKQSSWSLAPGVWCGFKQLQKRIRNWVGPSCDIGSRIWKQNKIAFGSPFKYGWNCNLVSVCRVWVIQRKSWTLVMESIFHKFGEVE